MKSKHESIKFPQYRRYKNGLSYFKILSHTELEEIKIIGKKHQLHHIIAKQYPEKVFINDLLFKYEEFAEVIGENVYMELKKV